MALPISNFAFLSTHDAQLMQLGALAERYFRDDPVTAIFKLRQFAELLSKTIAAHHALYLDERDTFEETLRRLSFDRIVPREAADIFHVLRKLGNAAAHETRGSHSDALAALRLARQLGVWFHRTYGKKPEFKPGPFIPPPEPVDATTVLREEIETLRRRVTESEDAASRARQEIEAHARARETAEDRLTREAEEGRVWQQLAKQAETERAALATRLATIQDARRRDLAVAAALAVKVDDAAHLEAIQASAEHAPKPEMLELLRRGEEAATKIDLDEAATRAIIDAQLSDAGWEADTKTLRHANGARPTRGRNLAIAEWPTASGPADYALFGGLTLVGIVEAKRQRKNVSAVPGWSAALSVAWVVVAQGIAGVAKDVTKTASKSAIKATSGEGSGQLFRWVAWFTGSKNAMKGIGFFVGGVLLELVGFRPALWLMAALLALILAAGVILLPREFGKAKSSKTVKELLGKSRGVNLLAAARIFMFGARDVWFVVGLPVFLYANGWRFLEVGGFLAAWTIAYGGIQAIAPSMVTRSSDGLSREVPSARLWAALLAAVPAVLAFVMQTPGLWRPDIILVAGLALFGLPFAVNSSLHSYLILAYAGSEKAAEDVGFYYAANATGRLLGIVLSGLLYQIGGMTACLSGSAVMLTICWLVTFLFPTESQPYAPRQRTA